MVYKTPDDVIKEDKMFLLLKEKIEKAFPSATSIIPNGLFAIIACIIRKSRGESCHRYGRRGGHQYDLWIGSKDASKYHLQRKIALMLGYEPVHRKCYKYKGFYACNLDAPSINEALDRIDKFMESKKRKLSDEEIIKAFKIISDRISKLEQIISMLMM